MQSGLEQCWFHANWHHSLILFFPVGSHWLFRIHLELKCWILRLWSWFFSFADTVSSFCRFELWYVGWFKVRNTYLFHTNSYLPIFYLLSKLYRFDFILKSKDSLPDLIPLFKAFIYQYLAFFLHFQDLPALSKASHQIMNLSLVVLIQFIPILFYKFLSLVLNHQLFISYFLRFHQSNHCKQDVIILYFFILKNLWFAMLF